MFGHVKNLRFFQKTLRKGIKLAAGPKGLDLWEVVQSKDIRKVVTSLCIHKKVELWVTFTRRNLQVMVVMLLAGWEGEGPPTTGSRGWTPS